MVANAKEFLLAIKETAQTEYDTSAVEFLEDLVTEISKDLTGRGVKGRKRDAWLFFEGMLKGVQLRLRRDAIQQRAELARRGALGAYDGTPKEKLN